MSLSARVFDAPVSAPEALGLVRGRTNSEQSIGDLCANRRMLPFVLDMEHLFELFVAEWIRAHLPEYLRPNTQQRVHIGTGGNLHFDIDLVLEDLSTGEAVYILDTKYKAPEGPSAADLAQVVAYAEAKRCIEAALVFPASLREPLDERVGDIHVRSLTFFLGGDLEAAGQAFLGNVLASSSGLSATI